MKNKFTLGLLCLLTITPLPSIASDGNADINNKFPSVGAYYELMVSDDGTVEWAEESCTATLISDRVALTAAHCTDYNIEHDGLIGYYNEAWITFDVYASKNDFHCFLRQNSLDHDVAGPEDNSADDQLPCNQDESGNPIENEEGIPQHNAPTFFKVTTTGWVDGKSVTVGITHSDYLKDRVRHDGTIQRSVSYLGNLTDLAVLMLETPVSAPSPMPIAATGYLNTLSGLNRMHMIGVGYGLDWRKVTGERPTSGLGPQQLGGGSGVKRIANIGTIQTLHENSITPTQQPNQGDNVLCFGDSGSPLFLDSDSDGQADRAIVGVLSGWTNWCQGSNDPYSRIDTTSAQQFLSCVLNAGTYSNARNCGGEKNITVLCPTADPCNNMP